MKTYREIRHDYLISEEADKNFYGFFKDAWRSWRNQKNYLSAVKKIERKYPGVNHFLHVASEWAELIDPSKNIELFNMLVKLSKNKHLQDFSDVDLRDIFLYIHNNGLSNHQQIRKHFISSATNISFIGIDRRKVELDRRNNNGDDYNGPDRRSTEKLKQFKHFSYKKVDPITMKEIHIKTGMLKKLAKNVTFSNLKDISMIVTSLVVLYAAFNPESEFSRKLADFLRNVNFVISKVKSGIIIDQEEGDKIKTDLEDILKSSNDFNPGIV